MRRHPRVLGSLVCAAVALGLGACAAPGQARDGVTNAQPSYAAPGCIKAGDACRWDSQCCSGRCYVDTGCSG